MTLNCRWIDERNEKEHNSKPILLKLVKPESNIKKYRKR